MPTASAVILVVEDEPLQLMMAVDLVETAGFDVVEARSADEAVRILENRLDIRVVFTDIDMPGGVDGMKLAAMIRDRWPPIELIIISGKHRPTQEDLPVRGVFFSKPYKRDEVTRTLQQFAA
ncbi:response regulator [Methylobacterium sp. NFXW15]|uniref:response regulator n=1 Tax=Methylobacterium sp. NFXW15 TaxID=2819512 RepID=UPI003CEA8F61